ncbi:MAG: DNA mismatch repair protein MutS [Candidatus Krumholzibacteriota bacterium]|nr:DNA mismatch repair protein MutS [Candidatus Krumholzibacteriota bacterium]
MASRQTPLMVQYREVKKRHPDAILFFQVGDFYETFEDDAREISRILNIALTSRDRDSENPVPLAGVPVHAAETYISRLLGAGKTVVVCDQVEQPTAGKKLVRREVVDVVTPGTTLSPSTLDERENNFVAAAVVVRERCGFAMLDLSTGEFDAGENTLAAAENILAGYRFREAVVPRGGEEAKRLLSTGDGDCSFREIDDWRFGAEEGRRVLLEHFAVENLVCFGIDDEPLAAAAAGALLGWVGELRGSGLKHITGLRRFATSDTLFLDAETLRNLELFDPIRGGAVESTLVYHVDRTLTAPGARVLRSWLRHPSRAIAAIEARLAGIDALVSDQIALRALRGALGGFPDVERLLARISAEKAGPRELLALSDALGRAPQIADAVRGIDTAIVLDAASDLRLETGSYELIRRSIEPGSPPHLRDGGVVRRGFDERLDRLIDDSEGGKRWVAALQESERKRTGISSLKVGFNRVFGYYIEVSRAHADKVPGNYAARQTLVASQRYVTAELKEREQSILLAEARRVELEKTIFAGICRRIAAESATLQRIAAASAKLDVLAGLADLAIERHWCRPAVDDSNDLVIVGGRHPVVEALVDREFIPNDLVLRPDERQVIVITGPNMGGKSTFIRQAAIISILAHAGSFVPADRAEIGLMDRVFTRVGSSDNLAKGQSTFLVEMGETAKILHNCTSRSLVLLDEVGRGTSTLDGLSLAWAVTEFLIENERRRPKTLFATHYHELTRLADLYPGVHNMRVDVKEWGNRIIFLYRIVPGACDRSYGIHVAQLAGLPASVIRRAGAILDSLEEGEQLPGDAPAAARQPSLFDAPDPLRDRLLALDTDRVTPIDALRLLDELRRLALETRR